MLSDLKAAVHAHRSRPFLFIVIVLSVAVAIAVNATVFSLANTLFFRPLTIEEPDRWVSVYATRQGEGSFLVSYPEFTEIRNEPVFADAVAHGLITMVVAVDGPPFETTGAIVSENYFAALNVPLPRGGELLVGASGSVAYPRAVISDQFWARHFDRSDAAVGSELVVNGQNLIVSGVAPPNFDGTFAGVRMDLWVPVSVYDVIMPVTDTLQSRMSRRFDVNARLADGVSRSAAQEAMSGLALRSSAVGSVEQSERGYLVTPVTGVRPGVRGPIVVLVSVLGAVVFLVLVIACANVAGLLLVRVTERHAELAVRMALGASRVRLVRMLIVESLVLGMTGGVVGLLAVFGVDRLVTSLRPDVGIPLSLQLQPDLRVAGLTLAVALGAGVLFGAAPAMHCARTDIAATLRGVVGSVSSSRLRSVLIVLQLSFSVALLIGMGLLVKNMVVASGGDVGFDESRITIVTLDVDLLRYTSARGIEFYDAALRTAAAIPGVEAVAAARYVPLAAQSDRVDVTPLDASDTSRRTIYYNIVSPRYFETIGIAILSGRDFRRDDDNGEPPVIVNESMARLLGGNVVGQRLRLVEPGDSTIYSIVGVVADIRYRSVQEAARPYLYLPLGHRYSGLMTLHLRVSPRALPPVAALTENLHALDPNLAVTNAGPIRTLMRFVQMSQRVVGAVLFVATVLAVLMCLVGVYALVAFLVNQREREFGIHMALGAGRARVVAMVMRLGFTLLVVGVGLGFVLGLALGSVLAGLLVGVQSFDLAVYGSGLLLVGLVYIAATLRPATRATRVDPTIALRLG